MEERFPAVGRQITLARDLLQDLMAERGVAITRLCTELGWSRTYFHDLARRRTDLKLVHILAILHKLDIPPASFFVELAKRYEAAERKERGEKNPGNSSEESFESSP